ncbi:MAG: HAD family hydrolase [Candidatus Woesearchaeota archaeon]|nr:HAD family hydrolase [Candidatus Woesearchaeota archaeon]
MLKIKAVIFDFDGVVIDSRARAFEVWEFAFKKFKKKDVKLDRDFFEADYKDLAKKINISKNNLKEVEKLFFHSKTPVYLFKGIKRILNTLSKKYKLALVSNNPPNRLKQYGIFNYFKAVIGIRSGIRLKPHPDMIHLALKKLGARPEEAMFIGDMEGDILAGKAAGVFVIGASYGFHTHVRLKGADVIIDSQNDIIPTIRKIEKGLL